MPTSVKEVDLTRRREILENQDSLFAAAAGGIVYISREQEKGAFEMQQKRERAANQIVSFLRGHHGVKKFPKPTFQPDNTFVTVSHVKLRDSRDNVREIEVIAFENQGDMQAYRNAIEANLKGGQTEVILDNYFAINGQVLLCPGDGIDSSRTAFDLQVAAVRAYHTASPLS